MVADERNLLIGADARLGADRQVDCAETVRPAIDQVAEKNDRALPAAPRLACGFIDERD